MEVAPAAAAPAEVTAGTRVVLLVNVAAPSTPSPNRPHAPPLQPPEVQTPEHEPQWATSLEVSISHPSDALPLQSENGATHETMVHDPPLHPGVACDEEQTVEQPPQCEGSVDVSTHADEQHVFPVAHACVGSHPGTHAPPLQTVPAAQSGDERHATHACFVVSQKAVGALHPGFA